MNKKIFRSSLLTVCLVLTLTIALILGVLFQFFEKQIQKGLKNEAGFFAYAVEKEGLRFLTISAVGTMRLPFTGLSGITALH